MPIILKDYPILTDEHRKRLALKVKSSEISFSYTNSKGELFDLVSSPADKATSTFDCFKLEDPNGVWHPNFSNLIIRQRVETNPSSFLFGVEGVCCQNEGELGVAIIWIDKESGERGVITPSGSHFTSKSQNCSFQLKFLFAPKSLRGSLLLQYVLYIKKGGIPTSMERKAKIATEIGTILGVLHELEIIIDGSGALFPVQDEYSHNDSLWWVTYDSSDPMEDSFTMDNFCLHLNKNHKDYDLLIGNDVASSSLLAEVMASTIQLLILETYHIMGEGSGKLFYVSNNDIKPDSIVSVVRYYLDTYEITKYDLDNEQALARKLRAVLRERF